MIPSIHIDANTFGELVNDTQQLIQLMNQLTDGPQFNANSLMIVTKMQVTNLVASGTVTGLNTSSVSEGTNLYFTSGRARSNISNSSPITYDSTNGIVGLANSGVSSGTYGGANVIPVVVVDSFGRVVSSSNTALRLPVAKNGVIAASRGIVNFVPGSNVSITLSDDSSNNQTNIAIDAVVSPNSARAAFSNTTPITYDIGNGIFGHATSGVSAIGYGSTIQVPVVVVDSFGHVLSVTNTTIRSANTSQTGVVQLNDTVTSNSTALAATANSVNAVNNVVSSLGTMSQQSSGNVNISGGLISGTNISATRVTEALSTYTPTLNQALTIDWGSGGSNVKTNGTHTITFANISSGVSGHVMVTDNLSRMTLPAAVTFGLGGMPIIAGTAVVPFMSINAGVVIFASIFNRAV